MIWYVELPLGEDYQINIYLFFTYSKNTSVALTYFRHVCVLTNFHMGSFISILYIQSNCL